MTVQPEEFHPAAGFPPGTRDDWRRLALGVLRRSGAEVGSPEEALAFTTYDGVTLRPLYDAADLPGDPGVPGFAPYTRGARPAGGVVSGWDVRQRHAHPDPSVTREAVLTDLENGVTSVWLVLGDGGRGPAARPRVLDGVYLDLAPVVLDAGARTGEAAEIFLRVADGRGIAPAGGNLGADPLGLKARTGAPAAMAGAVELARRAREHPSMRAITVDATPYHDAGGSDTTPSTASSAAPKAELSAAMYTAIRP
ncbi:methylmalonyl-CoA mutase family protein, partial [Sphaerisporangium sp. NPDC049002]|uniref:methylmalonyl-CoA mutase family protein n=1 Tax=Sphaerisporangium sp. NPDC049002 TaxID=3155392 RepID=UPI0033D0ED5C